MQVSLKFAQDKFARNKIRILVFRFTKPYMFFQNIRNNTRRGENRSRYVYVYRKNVFHHYTNITPTRIFICKCVFTFFNELYFFIYA